MPIKLRELLVELLIQGGSIVVVVRQRRVDLSQRQVSPVLLIDLFRRRPMSHLLHRSLQHLDVCVVQPSHAAFVQLYMARHYCC